ncbi:general stress protein CsbD [Mycobacterium sp. M26]|uniref:microaggregate-binding protein 1 n=1 Tax=Mycobacterium sp. M26 TaxID=1762962 RepID=UPI00073F88A6|nr:general stress protein CsbD [Mycobacterium sp. M26]
MSDAKDIAKDAAGGLIEDLKGKAKEVVGTVTGRDDLVREGQAQQDKAAAQREAAAKEAEAEKARAQAKVHEARQQAEQK